MTTRGDICDKWHRYCGGCGTKHHLNKVRQMDGNECCSGFKFTRDKTAVLVERPRRSEPADFGGGESTGVQDLGGDDA